MKIAILTQPLNTNYGGILQAWALQQILIRMGHAPVTVDRQYNQRQRASLARVPGRTKRLLQDAALATRGKALYQRHIDFVRARQREFIKGNIRLTPVMRNDMALRQYFDDNAFDAVVVGSDQVWRPRYSPRIETYFLDFVGELPAPSPRTVAYAASFGVDEWEFSPEQTLRCRELAKRFDAISVRERSAVELCRDQLEVSAELVADPTLLLDRKDYIDAFCSGAVDAADGVFTYILDPDDLKDRVVAEVTTGLGLDRYSRQPRPGQGVVKRSDLQHYQFPPTDAWVRGFLESKFVITDSFHGTIFALIFEKPFIAIVNAGRGAARFRSILELVGLSDRLVSKPEDFDIDRLTTPIDFSEVRQKLGLLRSSSMAFLRAHL